VGGGVRVNAVLGYDLVVRLGPDAALGPMSRRVRSVECYVLENVFIAPQKKAV